MMTRDVLLEMDQEEDDDDDGDIGERGVPRRGPAPEEVGDCAWAPRPPRGAACGDPRPLRGARAPADGEEGARAAVPGPQCGRLAAQLPAGRRPREGRGGAGRARAAENSVWAGRGRSL